LIKGKWINTEINFKEGTSFQQCVKLNGWKRESNRGSTESHGVFLRIKKNVLTLLLSEIDHRKI
jgi:hypothetical protein